MKLMVVRILYPPPEGSTTASVEPITQVAYMCADLAVQDKEDAAILVHVSTMAPRTPYSTPQVVWRPDGSGVFVNGDDGVLRGTEVKTGKVSAILKDGHEVGSKIRSIWCGNVHADGRGEEEWLLSGGFDHKLIVWRCKAEAET